jgi:outer membrane usher protein
VEEFCVRFLKFFRRSAVPMQQSSKTEAIRAKAQTRLGLLPTWILAALASPSVLHAAAVDPAATADPSADPAAVTFDTDFFPTGMAPKVDLSRFEKAGAVAPGTYSGDVTFNGVWRAHTDIVMAVAPNGKDVVPCFDKATLANYGVDLKKLAADTTHPDKKLMPDGNFCSPIGDYIPGATTSFDGGEQTLSIDVPQIYASHNARGWVDPSQWNAGINAAVIGYNANAYRSDTLGRSATNAYLGLNVSQHLGSWSINHTGSLGWAAGNGHHYQSSSTFLQHDIPSLQAQLLVGDSFTPGDMFDSVRLRGVRLFSDDRMLPNSLRGYAPVVHGVAETNAHVIIRQHGYIVYDTNVAPGPFAIDDLYPTGYGGDLEVEQIEADGRVKRFKVPFAAVPMSLRPGMSRWSLAAGEMKQVGLVNAPKLLQGTYQRGLTNLVTGYGGAVVGTDYASVIAGAALNTNVGAFAADVTGSRNRVPGQAATSGTSVRLSYNKNLADTGTNFGIAAYRYSTSGFVGLQTAADMRNAVARDINPATIQRQRNRMDVNISQNLGDRWGQFFLNGSVMDYWNARGRQVNFSAGYSNHWKLINFSVTAQRTRDTTLNTLAYVNPISDTIPGEIVGPTPNLPGRADTSVFLTVSMPLGRSASAPMFNAMANHSQSGGDNQQASITGALGSEQRMTYGATLSHDSSSGTSANLNGQYNGSHGNYAAGYSHSSNYSQVSASTSGSLILHAGGYTFSPPTGDTIGLVHAPHAKGARVAGGQGSVVDGNGYAVVPFLQPYQLNAVELDPKNASANVEIKSTRENVAPRAGTVVLLNYETTSGRAVLVETALPDGRPIPFGAQVLNEKGDSIGVAGQASRLYINNMPASGTVTVQWGEGEADSCQVAIQLKAQPKGVRTEMEKVQAQCTPKASAVTTTPLPPSPAIKPVAVLNRASKNQWLSSAADDVWRSRRGSSNDSIFGSAA